MRMELERPRPEVIENIEESFGGPYRGRTFRFLIEKSFRSIFTGD
jgi:hypothetical protein